MAFPNLRTPMLASLILFAASAAFARPVSTAAQSEGGDEETDDDSPLWENENADDIKRGTETRKSNAASDSTPSTSLQLVYEAGPEITLTSAGRTQRAVVVGTDAGYALRSFDDGKTFAAVSFGDPVWMPSFQAAPRSALNIVLGTSVVIPGRTPAADLIRRPPPTRTRRTFVAPQAASNALYQITNYGRLGKGLWMSYATDRLFFYHNPASLFTFDSETGAAFLEEGGTNMDSPAFWTSPWVRGLPRADFWWFEQTSRVSYDGSVRQARHWSRALLFHPDVAHGATEVQIGSHGEILLLSSQGVFLSHDDGESFSQVFSPPPGCCHRGAMIRERSATGVVESSLIIVADATVYSGASPHIAFVPRAEILSEGDALVVAADRSAAWLWSTDSHSHTDDATPLHAPILVSGAPSDEVLVTTPRGLFAVKKGVWVKAEESASATRPMFSQMTTGEDGRVWAVAGDKVFVDDSGMGDFEHVVTAPASIVDLVLDDDGIAFIITPRRIFRLAITSPPQLTERDFHRARLARQRDPPLDVVIAAAAERLVPRPSDRIYFAGMLPQLQVSLIGIGAVAAADLNAGFLTYALNGGRAAAGDVDRAVGTSDEATFIRRRTYYDFAITAFASWDLPEVILPNALPRRTREAKKVFRKVEEEIVHTYVRRRELRDHLVVAPPKNARAREAHAIQVDELSARLDALTGGLFKGTRRYASNDKDGSEASAIAKAAAQNYFVDDSALRSRLFRSAIKGVLPSAELYARATWARKVEPTYNFELLDGETPWIDRIGEGSILDTRLSLVWDLPRLMFNSEQLDVYRLVHVQRLVKSHALKTHFRLRQLDARRAGRRLGDVDAMLTAIDREEQQKILDVLTGDFLPTRTANGGDEEDE